ncbi:unnamed protein product [Urochloa decumbens]|uniref:MATH domain-containing protein n=1 Tax=Urochloa decumbens TaxID=240449 RepID=A0ABC9C013_9POAL
MAAALRPRRKTASRCSPPATAHCTHTFEIAGYSLYKDLPTGKFVQSASFAVGGHNWRLIYFPNGHTVTGEQQESKDYVSVFLVLLSKVTGDVTVLVDIRLVDQTTGVVSMPILKRGVRVFNPTRHTLGVKKFKKKSKLEAMPYLKDDRIVIECDLTVVVGTMPVSGSRTFCEIQVPPSDLSSDLGKLLETEEEVDVAFKVEGEIFRAHKIVLAMRALLKFIYTDSLPAMDDLSGGEGDEMIKHLLVAADRYAMERMKLFCESILCKRLSIGSVGTILALADQHHCAELKDGCIEFINSLDRKSDMEGLVASQGYKHLKRECPALFVDMWEKAAKSRKF